jgi:hypothetical protein
MVACDAGMASGWRHRARRRPHDRCRGTSASGWFEYSLLRPKCFDPTPAGGSTPAGLSGACAIAVELILMDGWPWPSWSSAALGKRIGVRGRFERSPPFSLMSSASGVTTILVRSPRLDGPPNPPPRGRRARRDCLPRRPKRRRG